MVIKTLCIICILISVVKCIDAIPKLINTSLLIIDGSYRIELRGPGSNKIWNRAIDQEYDHTWIYNQTFDESLTNESRKILTLENATVYEDNYTFVQDSDIELNNFPIKVNEGGMSLLHSGVFGFAFKFQNKSHSIVHRLYNKGYINHLAYSFLPNNTMNGFVFFGGIPDEIRKTKQSGKCKVINTSSRWSCQLKKVTFGHFVYSNKHPMYFQAADESIHAPQDFIDVLKIRIFDDYIKEDICQITQISNNDVIKCKVEEIHNFPPFNFIIEDHQYSLNAIDLFDMSDSKFGYLNILTNLNSNTTWEFGISFLKQFDSLFDYEGEYIELFSDTKIEYVKVDMLLFFVLVTGVLVAGILFNILFKCFIKDDE